MDAFFNKRLAFQWETIVLLYLQIYSLFWFCYGLNHDFVNELLCLIIKRTRIFISLKQTNNRKVSNYSSSGKVLFLMTISGLLWTMDINYNQVKRYKAYWCKAEGYNSDDRNRRKKERNYFLDALLYLSFAVFNLLPINTLHQEQTLFFNLSFFVLKELGMTRAKRSVFSERQGTFYLV